MLEPDNGMSIGMGDGVNKALFLVITIFRSLMLFNSIAHRKAKFAYNFGLS